MATSPINRSQLVRVPGGVVRVTDPFTALERQVLRLFDDFKEPGQPAAPNRPPRIGAVDVTEDPKGYTISIEVPGVEESDIKLATSGGVLTISGEKKKPEVEEGTKFHLSGRVYTSFEDSFAIPEDADTDKITASLKSGVLTVRVPRKAEVKPAERTIPIQSA